LLDTVSGFRCYMCTCSESQLVCYLSELREETENVPSFSFPQK